MKPTDLFKAIGEIDDVYVQEAMENKEVKKIPLRRIIALTAACLLLVVGIYSIYNIVNKNEIVIVKEEKLEEKKIIKDDTSKENNETKIEKPIEITERKPLYSAEYFQGMGSESFLANNPDELINPNPWNESMRIDEMPVYIPKYVVKDEDGNAKPPNTTRMKEKLLQIIESLGLTENDFEIVLNEDSQDYINSMIENYKNKGEKVPYYLFGSYSYNASNENYRIVVDSNMNPVIYFKNISNFDELNLEDVESEVEKEISVAEYLKEKYNQVYSYINPEVAIVSTGYDSEGKSRYLKSVYDKSGTDVEKLVKYSLKSSYLGASFENGLIAIHFDNFDDYEVYDNYPVIGIDEAKAKLYNGEYVSSNHEKIDKSNEIVGTSINYMGLGHNPQIPFYRFVMDMNTKRDGYKVYSAYYVCAIDNSYFDGGEIYKGEFNY